MEPCEWPFKIIHITSDGEDAPEGDDLRKLTGEGIIPHEYLQGIQTSICFNLQHPTTIIEFSPDGAQVRTDSYALAHKLHPSCEALKRYTGCYYCYESDSIHFALFQGLSISNLASEMSRRIDENSYIKEYRRNSQALCQFVDNLERGYLAYDCPILGYRQLLFPIFVEGGIHAVFSLEQLVLEERVDFVKSKQMEFFAAHPDCFAEYQREYPECNFLDLQNEILSAHEQWLRFYPDILTRKKYIALIEQASDQLSGLERRLEEQMELRRERYVREHVNKVIQAFQNSLPFGRQQAIGDESLQLLWQSLEQQLRQIVSQFALRYIIVFSIASFTKVDNDTLDVVAEAGSLPPKIKQKIRTHNLLYDMGRLREHGVISSDVTSAMEDDLFKAIPGLTEALQRETNLVSMFYGPFVARAPIAVLIGYYSSNPGISPANHRNGYFQTSLRSFFAVVSSALSSLLAAIAKSNMEATYRVYSHEAGQLIAGLDWLREAYLSSPQRLRDISDEKAADISRDLEGLLRQLFFLTRRANTAILVTPPKLNKIYFKPFRELLFKWKDTYRMESEEKKIQFVVYYPQTGDLDRPDMYGDQDLLEQLIYNLVSNAVKYSYRGTKIHLDCKKSSREPASPHVLTVTDYGKSIENSERIYELYYRGEDALKEDTKGMGIGLYVARQIAVAHGGSIEHTCRLVSEFNVPLIDAYLHSDAADEKLIPALQRELIQLITSGQYYDIVAFEKDKALKYSDPSFLELINSITIPTWEVVFAVTVPAGEV